MNKYPTRIPQEQRHSSLPEGRCRGKAETEGSEMMKHLQQSTYGATIIRGYRIAISYLNLNDVSNH